MQDLWWLSGKEPACNAGAAGDLGLIPGSGRYSGGGHDNPVHNDVNELSNKIFRARDTKEKTGGISLSK